QKMQKPHDDRAASVDQRLLRKCGEFFTLIKSCDEIIGTRNLTETTEFSGTVQYHETNIHSSSLFQKNPSIPSNSVFLSIMNFIDNTEIIAFVIAAGISFIAYKLRMLTRSG